MSTMTLMDLPPDILARIVSDDALSCRDQLTLRLVNRHFAQAWKQFVYRRIAEKLQSIKAMRPGHWSPRDEMEGPIRNLQRLLLEYEAALEMDKPINGAKPNFAKARTILISLFLEEAKLLRMVLTDVQKNPGIYYEVDDDTAMASSLVGFIQYPRFRPFNTW